MVYTLACATWSIVAAEKYKGWMRWGRATGDFSWGPGRLELHRVREPGRAPWQAVGNKSILKRCYSWNFVLT